VIADHWHGITVMGARNVRIVNNTVIDPNRVKPGPPWVTITKHKNGTPPENSFIINNLAPSFNAKGFSKGHFPTSRKGVTARNNMRVFDPVVYFRDPAKGDLRLIPGSRPVDAGTLDLTPAEDIDGAPRLRGKSVDVGAYELQ
ncbi:MAG: choice-of-anchor Q domain-containing protein, partial [Hyphomicrobiales bacterium]